MIEERETEIEESRGERGTGEHRKKECEGGREEGGKV
jgi:hypothetical protein